MTAPAPVSSVIIEKIFEHYRMLEGDIASLNQQLTQQLTVTYRQVIQSQLALYGCQKLATGPDSEAQRWIAEKAQKDSEGIARTYDRELRSQINRIYQGNKKTNRYGYMRALDAWIAGRNLYKVPSISLNTMVKAREYAAQRFRDENNIQTKMRFVGPPPVCKKCLQLKGLGLVTVAAAKKYGDSQHPSCPHRWEAVIPTKIKCGDETWTG